MHRNTAIALFLAVAAIAGTSYFVIQRKQEQQIEDEIIAFAKPEEKLRLYNVVMRMTPLEQADTLRLLKTVKAGMQVIDPALKKRLEIIGAKYNIFT